MRNGTELADEALEALLATWEAQGPRAIATVRTLDPATYIKIVARVAGQGGWPEADGDEGFSSDDVALLLSVVLGRVSDEPDQGQSA